MIKQHSETKDMPTHIEEDLKDCPYYYKPKKEYEQVKLRYPTLSYAKLSLASQSLVTSRILFSKLLQGILFLKINNF